MNLHLHLHSKTTRGIVLPIKYRMVCKLWDPLDQELNDFNQWEWDFFFHCLMTIN